MRAALPAEHADTRWLGNPYLQSSSFVTQSRALARKPDRLSIDQITLPAGKRWVRRIAR
jgi:hypothetical protein